MYPYIYADANHEKNLTYIPILKFKIVNGEMILTYNINDDPMFNKDVRVITERDTLNPEVGIEGKVTGRNVQATYNIVDKDGNFKSAWWSIDGGKTRTSIGQSGTINLTNLPYGDYNLIVRGEDHFRLKGTGTWPFKIVNTPLGISISSPLEGMVYNQPTQLKFNITDGDGDFDKALYSINGGPKISIGMSGTIPLEQANGTYKIVIEAWDKFPQVTKDSVSYKVAKTETIEDKVILYPNPVKEYLNIKHESKTQKTIYREIYDINGKLMDHDKIEISSGVTENRIYVGNYAKGTYFIQFIDGTEKKRIKFIKE